MAKKSAALGHRERQIVEAVYRLGEASVGEVRELASDDSVLLAGEDAIDYANHLVDIAASINQQFRVPAGARVPKN